MVYALARAAAAVVSILPLPIALLLGRFLGGAGFFLAPRLARRAVEQVAFALDLDGRSAHGIAREVFANMGAVAVEIALLPRLRPRLRDYVELGDADRRLIEETLAKGKGAVFVSAHVGNWELLAQRIALEGFDAVAFAREAPNPYLGRWIVEARKAAGLETINRGTEGAPRRILSALRRGALLGILLDQSIRAPSVDVPFFGRPAPTPTAASELALRRGLPVIAGFAQRRSEGGYRVRLERIDLGADLDGDQTEDARVRSATARMSSAIEAAIRTSPSEWVWFHDRWRPR